jgi:hypothetical protein
MLVSLVTIYASTMRTIGFRTNILFAIAAAFGVIAALGKPWYGPSNAASDAQMEDLFGDLARIVGEPAGTSGWDALQTADQLIAGLAIATVALLTLTFVPTLQRHVQALARWGALATVGVVLYTLVDGPGTTATAEPRHGMLLALAASLVLLTSAWTVAEAPSRRRVAPKAYTPPPAPAPVVGSDDERWGPPQF